MVKLSLEDVTKRSLSETYYNDKSNYYSGSIKKEDIDKIEELYRLYPDFKKQFFINEEERVFRIILTN